MTIHPERACVIAVNCCVDQKESLLAIYYAKLANFFTPSFLAFHSERLTIYCRSGLRGSIKVGKELLDASMLCYMFGLWNLHDLAVNNCLDDVTYCICVLFFAISCSKKKSFIFRYLTLLARN